MTVRIIVSDCRTALRAMPDGSVNCIITSPPYWGLRDYGVDGQIGLEETPEGFVQEIVEVFRELRRVLRSDGVCFLNLGDSYAGSGRGGNTSPNTSTLQGSQKSQLASKVRRARASTEIGASARTAAVTNIGRRATRNKPTRFEADAADGGRIHTAYAPPPFGLKQKDLIGMPWRCAFALQADGWYLRQDIIWSKPNPMPESVTDRCTKSHEYLFLLSKSGRYFFDADAISEPVSPNTHARLSQDVAAQIGSHRANGGQRSTRPMKAAGRKQGKRSDGVRSNPDFLSATCLPVTRRNKRSVWTVGTEGFKEAHFATFPPALIEPCILAGCPKGGVVLDPFFGAGTTGLVADRLQRDCIGIELNPAYAAMAERRIHGDAPMFSDVGTSEVPA